MISFFFGINICTNQFCLNLKQYQETQFNFFFHFYLSNLFQLFLYFKKELHECPSLKKHFKYQQKITRLKNTTSRGLVRNMYTTRQRKTKSIVDVKVLAGQLISQSYCCFFFTSRRTLVAFIIISRPLYACVFKYLYQN